MAGSTMKQFNTRNKNKSTLKSPTKPSTSASASVNKHHHSHQAQGDDEDDEPELDLNDLLAIKENFELDLASHLRTLRLSRESALNTLERQWKTGRLNLPSQLEELSMKDFVELYGMDEVRALEVIVGRGIGQVEMGDKEREIRNLKRAAPSSPSHPKQTDTNNNKKARPAPSSATKKKVPLSSTRNGGRSRPNTANAANASPSTSRGNFVYTTNPSSSFKAYPHLPPTPSLGPTGRKPRRGESIILHSINGSPLGEVLAEDVLGGGGGDGSPTGKKGAGDEEEGEGEGWDLMERFEASRVEDNTGKGKGKGKAKATKRPTTRSRSTSLSNMNPPATAFQAPSKEFTYDPTTALEIQLKESWKKELMKMLESTEMSEGDKERLRGKFEGLM